MDRAYPLPLRSVGRLGFGRADARHWTPIERWKHAMHAYYTAAAMNHPRANYTVSRLHAGGAASHHRSSHEEVKSSQSCVRAALLGDRLAIAQCYRFGWGGFGKHSQKAATIVQYALAEALQASGGLLESVDPAILTLSPEVFEYYTGAARLGHHLAIDRLELLNELASGLTNEWDATGRRNASRYCVPRDRPLGAAGAAFSAVAVDVDTDDVRTTGTATANPAAFGGPYLKLEPWNSLHQLQI